MSAWPYPHISEAEFERSLEYARKMVYAYCRKSARRLDRDLMLSETYYRLARAAGRYRPEQGAWAPYAIVGIRGAILEELSRQRQGGIRNRNRERSVQFCSLDELVGGERDNLADLMAAEGPDPEACAVEARTAGDVWDLVRRNCTGPQARVLELHCIEDLCYSEIATRIDKSQTRVQQIVGEARIRLRPARAALEGYVRA